MPHLDDISGWISERLPTLLAEHKVPGAAIAVYADGEVFDSASGVLSHATGVEAAADSVFQIGSITKTWTATLVMQLADEGRLDLDATVVTYLPGFELADGEAARTMTVRQLLSHRAGFEGDIFTDTGTNDDCVHDVHAEALLMELRDLAAAHGDRPTGPVARLGAYDAEHGTNLVETLRAWLDAFGDVTAASAAMFVHANTFRYRLRRLTEVSGIDLTDPEQRFAAMLQLRAVYPTGRGR